jgi:hypothetical protein
MSTTITGKESRGLMSRKEVLIGIVVALVFIALYAVTLISYIQEGQTSAVPYQFGDEKEQNGILASAKVLSLDPVKGEMAVRVDLTPQGDLSDNGGYSATQNLTVFVNGATGQLERTFEKGKMISPFDVVVSLDGLVNDYPFDQYDTSLIVYVTAKADKDAEAVEVPVLLSLTANIPGFQILAGENTESTPSAPVVDLKVSRSNTVVSVAIAGMIIMWAIGIGVIFLTLTFLLGTRKAEAFAFYSGLLFGLFGLRNSLPGTPPIGTQSDYLAFMWVEAIVAVALVINIAITLRRPQK